MDGTPIVSDEGEGTEVADERDPLQLLLEVQAHDLELDRIAYRLRELPERAQLADVVQRQSGIEQQVAEADERRSGLARQQDELDQHVQALVSRISAIETRLASASAGSYRDQQAMGTETASLDHQRRELEDRELEIMEQLEPIEEQLAQLSREVEEIASEHANVAGALASVEESLEAERRAVASERAALAAGLPTPLAASYERLRAKLGGIGAAKLTDGTCSGCHLKLPAKELDVVRHSHSGTVFYCEQCGRILVP
ncbi:MAG: C4-type zinc ribbon domain-containing protein [Acidimicrobiales bacterium]